MLKCSSCKGVLEINSFDLSSNTARGRSFYCKQCRGNKYKQEQMEKEMDPCQGCYMRPSQHGHWCNKCLKPQGLKMCKKCDTVLLLMAFYGRKAVCKKCLKASKDS